MIQKADSTLCACVLTARSGCWNEIKEIEFSALKLEFGLCLFVDLKDSKIPDSSVLERDTHLTAGIPHTFSVHLLGICRRKEALKLSVQSVFNSILLAHWAVVTYHKEERYYSSRSPSKSLGSASSHGVSQRLIASRR